MIGGIAGFLLINKTINVIQNSIAYVCDASKWKAYYKHCKDPLVVPPGYACSRRPINNEEEVVVEDPSKKVDPEKAEKNKENASKIVESVTEAVKTIAKDVMDDRKKRKEEAEKDISEIEGIYENAREQIRKNEDILAQSVREAREAGVPEEKILHTEEEVDDLFTKEGDLNNDQTVD